MKPVEPEQSLHDRGRRPPPRKEPRIKAVPAIRQIYLCEFWEDALLPEFWDTRPVVIVSFKHTLTGHCTVLPISTDPQEGQSAPWAHKLSFKPDGLRDSWVVCNHPYTVSTARLIPTGQHIRRLEVEEFNTILAKLIQWLPKLP